jgi:hypothetical protein
VIAIIVQMHLFFELFIMGFCVHAVIIFDCFFYERFEMEQNKLQREQY